MKTFILIWIECRNTFRSAWKTRCACCRITSYLRTGLNLADSFLLMGISFFRIKSILPRRMALFIWQSMPGRTYQFAESSMSSHTNTWRKICLTALFFTKPSPMKSISVFMCFRLGTRQHYMQGLIKRRLPVHSARPKMPWSHMMKKLKKNSCVKSPTKIPLYVTACGS